jgi:hypothetical protein
MLGMLSSTGGGFPFFKLESGERKRIRFMLTGDEGRAAMTHSVRVRGQFIGTFTCLGTAECPGCQRNDRPGYKMFIPVLDYKGEMVGMMAGGKRLGQAIAKLHQAYGDIRFRDAIVERTGSSFQTRYTILPAVKRDEYAKIIADMEGDEVGDTNKILLSGDVTLSPVPIPEDGMKIVQNALELEEGVTAAGVFDAVREYLLQVCAEMVAPPTIEQITAMYQGRTGESEGSEETSGDDFV